MEEVIPDADEQEEDRHDRPGTLLRRAREEKGMTLGEVAEMTRVAQRQLEAIERSDFGSLPGTPYAVGFARAYARAVGADEVAVARGVREELGTMEATDRYEAFEPVDPARIPPRNLAWIAAAIALILAVGYAVWRTQFFAASTDQEISDLSNRASERPTSPEQAVRNIPSAPQITSGPVVLTALNDVWLRIYDQSGERLYEGQMEKGGSYTVPPQANNPMILTGRPDALAVTVGGKPVAPLGPADRTIADVPVSAAALLARGPADDQGPAPISTPATAPRAASPGGAATTEAGPAPAPSGSIVPASSQLPSEPATRETGTARSTDNAPEVVASDE